MQIIHNLTRL